MLQLLRWKSKMQSVSLPQDICTISKKKQGLKTRQLRTCSFIIILLGLVNGFVPLTVNADFNQNGDSCMNSKQIVKELRETPVQRNKITSLSRHVEEYSLAPIKEVTKLLNDANPSIRNNAMHLLSDIDDLAIIPLLESLNSSEVFDKLWKIDRIVTAHLEVREKIVAQLDLMLTDKTPIKYETDRRAEEQPLPSRVCDEAYLLMRSLLNTKEGELDAPYIHHAFLALSDKEKDAEIIKAKKSRAWSNLLGHEE